MKRRIYLLLSAMFLLIFGSMTMAFADDSYYESKPDTREKYTLSVDDADISGKCEKKTVDDKSYISSPVEEGDKLVFSVDIEGAFFYDLSFDAKFTEETEIDIMLDGERLTSIIGKAEEEGNCVIQMVELSKGKHEISMNHKTGSGLIAGLEITMKDKGYDLSKSVPAFVGETVGICLIAFIILMVLLFIWIRHAYPGNSKGTVMGVASYFLLCSCLLVILSRGEAAVTSILTEGIEQAAAKTAISNVCQIIGITVECGVLIACLYLVYIKFFINKGTTKYGNVLSFAFGYALMAGLLWGEESVFTWMYAQVIGQVGLKEIVYGLGGSIDAAAFLDSIEKLLEVGPLFYMLKFLNRILFVVFAIAESTMLYMVAMEKVEKKKIYVAWGMYILYYLPTIMQYFGIFDGTEILMVIESALILLMAAYVRKIFIKACPADYDELKEIKSRGVYTVIFNNSKRAVKTKKTAGSITKNANSGRDKQ